MDAKDKLFPLFVMQVMGDVKCIPGLFIAGIFSGALSTVSSGINALAAVTIHDFIQGAFDANISDKQALWISKGLALLYGFISYGAVYVVKYTPGVLDVRFICSLT